MNRRALLAAIAAASLLSARSPRARPAALVAAASSLRFVLPGIAADFAAETGHRVELVFGASGSFYRQIRAGAPFALFLSADSRYVERLHAEGVVPDPGVVYALGRLVLFAHARSPLAVDARLDGLARALDRGEIRRFAIANPDRAPYGSRAVEVLEHRGLWPRIRPFLVYAENVSQAAQFAVSGSCEGAIFARALGRSPRIRERGRQALLPASWHRPLEQRMVLLDPGNAAASAFFAHLTGASARRRLEGAGFDLPARS